MKQIKKSKLTQILLIVLVLVMGLILALTKGFNKELKYKEHQEIKLEIGKEYKLYKRHKQGLLSKNS